MRLAAVILVAKSPNLRPLCPLCEKKKLLFSKVTGAVGNGWEGCFLLNRFVFGALV